MSGAESQGEKYDVPTGVLGLTGPVKKPAPGTLPLRGDLAHIALAGKHLAAHYVIPHQRSVGPDGADVMENSRDDSAVLHHFAAGTQIEVLDMMGEWIWACLGPDGPSGYLKAQDLDAIALAE